MSKSGSKDTKVPKDTKGTKGTKGTTDARATKSSRAAKAVKVPDDAMAPAAVPGSEGAEAADGRPARTQAPAPPAATPTAAKRVRKAAAPKPAGAAKAPTRPVAGLRVLMIASEVHPFSKTGGLADVAAALPVALGRLGHAVTVVTPRYRGVDAGTDAGAVSIAMAGYSFDVTLSEVSLGPGARVLLADCPPLFNRPGLYNEHNVDYGDNPLRFAVLIQAALRWAAAQPDRFDVVHAHDWQAGLAPAYLQAAGAQAPLAGTPSVFTIHNIAYQGVVDKDWVPRLGLDWAGFRAVDGFEFWDRLSLLKAGVNFADAVTTVSPTYALEIQRPEFGYGFDGVVRARADRLVGILNGIDTTAWDPAHDPYLPVPFTADDLSGKVAAKRALLERFGLPTDEASLARPVVGLVSRLVDQKGFDLIDAAASRLLELDATYVLVGSGDARYEDLWRRLAEWRPDRVGVFIGFDEARAHLVEGGADLFLMPSRYEPCGLNQMYSLRYGTVPVVRAVGGLVDSVRPYEPRAGQGTGFLFSEYHPEALVDAVTRALAAWQDPKIRQRLRKNGMRKDFSWDRSAAEYVKVYKRVIAQRRRGPAGAGNRRAPAASNGSRD